MSLDDGEHVLRADDDFITSFLSQEPKESSGLREQYDGANEVEDGIV